jgi:hypothetical protein
MALNATISGRISNTVVRVNSTGGRISPAAGGSGVTLKNQVQELRSIENIADVVGTNITEGATLVYNSATDKYEIKPISLADLGSLDGGLF